MEAAWYRWRAERVDKGNPEEIRNPVKANGCAQRSSDNCLKKKSFFFLLICLIFCIVNQFCSIRFLFQCCMAVLASFDYCFGELCV